MTEYDDDFDEEEDDLEDEDEEDDDEAEDDLDEEDDDEDADEDDEDYEDEDDLKDDELHFGYYPKGPDKCAYCGDPCGTYNLCKECRAIEKWYRTRG